MSKKTRIALLRGGVSGEREVSLKTGEQILNALDKDKYEVLVYDPKDDLERFVSDCFVDKFELAFPALHGPFGEDGRLQGLLDMIGVPYVFSGCFASALAMNKDKASVVARNAGLKTAKQSIIGKGDKYNLDEIVENLELPIVIKPVELGSSVGISINDSIDRLKTGIEDAFSHGDSILLEQFISGRELTVPVIEKDGVMQALPVIEIKPKVSEWFDYRAKYELGGSEEICPARIPDKVKETVQNDAIKVFKSFACRHLARADFIWNPHDDSIYFLEINTIPGMTETSLAPQSAKAAGYEFSTFLDLLIKEALSN